MGKELQNADVKDKSRARERGFVRDAECIQNTEKIDILLNMAFDCFR